MTLGMMLLHTEQRWAGGNTMVSVPQLSYKVAELLAAPRNEKNRFRAIDLCDEILCVADVTSDYQMLDTLRRWITKLQGRYNY